MSSAAIVHPKLAKACFERAIRPLLIQPELFDKIGIKFIKYLYPLLDVELDWYHQGIKLAVRIDGTDYRYRPISGWWIDKDGAQIEQGQQRVPAGNGFHTVDQDSRPRCWFCFPGWREYHDHSGHQDISWASIRRQPRYSVLQLIQQLRTDLNNMGVQRV